MADPRDAQSLVAKELAQATARGAQSALEAAARLAASVQCPNGCPQCAFTLARDVIVGGIRKMTIEVAIEIVDADDLN